MLNFKINQLRAMGPGKRDGVVDFTDGFNLICVVRIQAKHGS